MTDDFYGGRLTYRLTELAYTNQPRRHPQLPARLPVLKPNPVPTPDLRDPVRHRLTITGGMMGGMGGGRGMMGGGGGMMGGGGGMMGGWA